MTENQHKTVESFGGGILLQTTLRMPDGQKAVAFVAAPFPQRSVNQSPGILKDWADASDKREKQPQVESVTDNLSVAEKERRLQDAFGPLVVEDCARKDGVAVSFSQWVAYNHPDHRSSYQSLYCVSKTREDGIHKLFDRMAKQGHGGWNLCIMGMSGSVRRRVTYNPSTQSFEVFRNGAWYRPKQPTL